MFGIIPAATIAQVNFRINDETKRKAEELFNRIGLTMSGAIAIFVISPVTS